MHSLPNPTRGPSTSKIARHLTRVAVLFAVVLAAIGCQKQPGQSETAPLPGFLTLFSADQQSASDVQWWGGELLVTTWSLSNEDDNGGRFYTLDIKNMVARELLPPSNSRVLGFATGGSKQQLALTRGDLGLGLFARSSGAWEPVEIPNELRTSQATHIGFVSDGDQLLILAEEVVWRRLAGTWEHWPLPEQVRLGERPIPASHFALMGNRLHMGYSWGEWGGGVATLDLTTRGWSDIRTTEEMEQREPVEGFLRDATGTLWEVGGQGHRGLDSGSVRVLRDGQWLEVASVSSRYDVKTDSLVASEQKNWDDQRSVFADLASDSDGRVHLLAPSLGIYRYQNGKWQRRNNRWFDFSHSVGGDVFRDYPSHFVLSDDNTAVVAAGHFGVLVWNLLSDKITRIPIQPPLP